MLDDATATLAYPLVAAATAAGAAYGLAFAAVDSVTVSAASALGLQRAGVATRRIGLFEYASLVREHEQSAVAPCPRGR